MRKCLSPFSFLAIWYQTGTQCNSILPSPTQATHTENFYPSRSFPHTHGSICFRSKLHECPSPHISRRPSEAQSAVTTTCLYTCTEQPRRLNPALPTSGNGFSGSLRARCSSKPGHGARGHAARSHGRHHVDDSPTEYTANQRLGHRI